MHHHRWVVRVSRNVGMHGGAMTQLSRMGGHLGRRIAWLSHIHTHWTTPRHIIPWHALQPCKGRERDGGEWWGVAADTGPEAALLGLGEAGLQPRAGCGVTGVRAPLPLWNWESAKTHTDGNRNGPQVKNNPKNILPLPHTEFLEIKQLSAFMVRNGTQWTCS